MIERSTFDTTRREAFRRIALRAGWDYPRQSPCTCGEDKQCREHRMADAVARRFCDLKTNGRSVK